MTLKMNQAVCTATVEPGAGHVATVGHPSSDAISTLQKAGRIASRDHRKRRAETIARDEGRGFCVTSISMYLDDLADIDAAVEELKAAGRTDMTRSKLLRIGFRRLDIQALGRERRSE